MALESELEQDAPLDSAFPIGGGQLGGLMRRHDWSRSPLGPPETWSASLRTTVGLMLAAKAEIVLFWGPRFAALYNAYAPTIGDKHPSALGRPAEEGWAELWDDLGPLLRSVRDGGETVWAKDRPFQIERHGYLEQVWFDISYSPVREKDGSIGGVLCIVSETTDRVLTQRELAEQKAAAEEANRRLSRESAVLREAEEHLRLVINELNHRVKNTLATLQSIGEQTFRNAEDLAQAREKFLGRIMALSSANDLLNAERWAGASLGDVIGLTTEADRTSLDGPAVRLGARTAISLSMALHELATNARKYGAWSRPEGRVTVAWSTTADPRGGERLALEWRERGGPPVKPPAGRGFGSRLIERGLAQELSGEVELRFEPAGLVCRIEAPLAPFDAPA
ncbi:MAG: PAS domain-containing protein [Proteobacteria bacterium]|nr:PAS domain-containing protein [Pseudomonadota bacterium]